MKKLFQVTLLLLLKLSSGYAQCTNVPVKEAIRNGDFEAGYLQGPAGKNHQFTPGSDFDFYSDFNFIGPPANYKATDPCNFNIADKYAVMAAETFTCGNQNAPFVDNTYWGISYGGDKNFKDHTLGANGKGHALVIDLYQIKTSSKNPGGLPMAWEQTVNISPSQPYYFSAWLANFNANTPAKMQVTIMPINPNGTEDTPNKQTLPIAIQPSGLMQWTQLSAKWVPAGVYSKVSVRFEFVNVNGGASGLDVCIDDISFINSCQNLNAQNIYVADFNLPDTVNICLNNGSVLLDPHAPSAQTNNATVYWFSGNTNPQTQVSTGNWTKTINTSGTYRVCIDDPDNHCSVSDNVVVIENMMVPVSDFDLCSPSQFNIDAGFNIPNGAASAIQWSGSSGTSSTRNYTVNKPGIHTVNITSAAGLSCNYSKTFNVTSHLPTPPTNLDFCSGGGVAATLSVGDGKPYKWSTSQTMLPIIGSGVSVNWNVPANTNTDQTLWIQNAETTPLGTWGPTTASMTGYPGTIYPIKFNVNSIVQFNSFVVGSRAYAGPCSGKGAGTGNSNPITLTLTNPDGSTRTITQTINCDSPTTINANWILTPGAYTLTSSIKLNFSNTSGVNGNNTTVSVTSSGSTMFADLNFSNSSACDPVPVVVKAISCCAAPVDIPKIDPIASVLRVCAPNKATIVTKALSNGLDYKWQVSHNNGVTWVDSVGATGIVSGGKVTLPNVSANGWYRIVIANTGNINKSCVKKSDSAVVVIKSLPTNIAISVNPNKTQFCKNEAHTLTASATVTTGTPTYQWKLDVASTNASINGLKWVGTHNYRVVVNANGCVDSLTKTINVLASDSAKILSAGPFCAGAAPYVLKLTTGSTIGGTWTGTGVSAAGVFNPTGLSAGSYSVKYTTTGVCSAKDSVNISVTSGAAFQILSTKINYCKSSSIDTIEVNIAGGNFWTKSGQGIIDATKGILNPSLMNVGNDTLFYGVAGTCGDTAFLEITIVANDSVKVLTAGPFCSSDQPYSMQLSDGSTSGGTWSGNGITNVAQGIFNPGSVVPGTYKIKYSTTGSCAASDWVMVTVSNGIAFQFLSAQENSYCKNHGADTIQVNILGGVFWTKSGTGIMDAAKGYINPSLMNVGTDTLFYGKAGQCGDTIKMVLQINVLDIANINSVTTLCSSQNAQQLSVSNLSSAGTWSASCGACINVSGLFNPASASANNTITYTTHGACAVFDTIVITVQEVRDASIQAINSICKNGGKKQLHANATGGVFSGLGVSATGLFDPSLLNAGTYWIKYSQNGICSSVDSVQITVDTIPDVHIISSINEGCAPLTVEFTQHVMSPITMAVFRFGDGSQSLSANQFVSAQHTYSQAGIYDVWLKFIFDNGCVDSATTKVLVH